MDIKLHIVQKVEQCFVLAESYFSCILVRPKVGFDIRGQDAGRAYFPTGKYLKASNLGIKKHTEIKFNETLLENNPDFFLENIVAHECAHLIVYELFGTRILPHGKEWKGIMENVFKADSSVKHNLDVTSVTNKPFIYSCSCEGEGIALSQRQHNTAQKGAAYLCRRCKSKLKFSLEKKSENNKTKQEINGLYLDIKSESIINTDLFNKINPILGRKYPLRIYSSIDLTMNKHYREWLREKKWIRRYQGQVLQEQLIEMFESQKISHAIVFTEKDDLLDKYYWEGFRTKGLVLRHMRV